MSFVFKFACLATVTLVAFGLALLAAAGAGRRAPEGMAEIQAREDAEMEAMFGPSRDEWSGQGGVR